MVLAAAATEETANSIQRLRRFRRGAMVCLLRRDRVRREGFPCPGVQGTGEGDLGTVCE